MNIDNSVLEDNSIIKENFIVKEIETGFHIPPRPQILTDIDSLMANPDFDIKDVAELVTQDVGLASDVLKVVNSSTFGMNRTINDITQAVCFLGAKEIRSIAAATKLREAFDKDPCINLERFWDEAVDTANTMLFLNEKLGKHLPPDLLYSIGLFHDCGIVAMAIKYDNYRTILEQANKDCSIELPELEEQYLNTNHAIVGYYIASSWHLPKELCQLILRHHEHTYLQESKYGWSQR